MIKILMMLVVGFSLAFNNTYLEKIIEVDNMIVKEEKGYQLLLDTDVYIITDGKKEISFPKDYYIDMVVNDDCLIVLKEFAGYVNICKYSLTLNIILDVAYDNNYYQPKLISFNGFTYLVSNITEVISLTDINDYLISKAYNENSLGGMDGVIGKIGSDLNITFAKVYGGYLDDYFTNCQSNSEYLVVTGKKDYCSGGSFGNGGEQGANFIAYLGKDLKVVNYLVTRNDLEGKILDFYIGDASFSFLTGEGFFAYDFQNNEILSLKFDSICTFGYILSSYSFMAFIDSKFDLYDANNKSIMYTSEVYQDYLLYGYQYIYLESGGKLYRYDLYDISTYEEEIIYNYQENSSVIETIYGYYFYKETVYNDGFDASVWGKYQVVNYYENNNGDIINIDGMVIVEEEANVTEGYIYPYGYNLLFTGIGYLNGRLITQNYPVITIGENTLKLIGSDGLEKSINFTVEKGQVAITENMNKNYDYFGEVGSSIKLTIALNGIEDKTITSVYLNDSSYDFTIVDNQLLINLKIDTKGIKNYNLEFIEYEYNGKTYCSYLNYYFRVLGIKNDLFVDCNYLVNDDKVIIVIDLTDYYQTTRFIEVNVSSNNFEKSFCFSLAAKNFNLTGLISNEEYDYTINLLAYNGSNTLDRYIIGKGILIPETNDFYFGYNEIKESEDGKISFNIVIYRGQSVSTLGYGEATISMSKKDSKTGLIVGVSSGSVLMAVLFILRKKHIIFK